MKIRSLAVAALGGGALALAATAPALATGHDRPFRDSVHIVNNVDTGHHGYWAKLNLQRSVVITPGDAEDTWVVQLHDQGTFSTIGGAANSPRTGERVRGVRGTVSGDYTLTVTSATKPSTDNVANRYDYRCDVHGTGNRATDCPGMPAETSAWPALYFASAKVTPGAYSWTYHTDSCGGQTWVDASTNGDGTAEDAGDITGCKPCPPSSPSASPSDEPTGQPTGEPSTQPSSDTPSASPSSSGSPSESASAQPSLTPAGNGGGNGSGSLPVTGTSLGLIAGGAAALLGGGTALTVLARRRRSQP